MRTSLIGDTVFLQEDGSPRRRWIPIVFVVLMAIAITAFLLLWCLDPDGSQSKLFFGKTADFFADYFNVCEMSANLNPYFYGMEDPAPHEHAYPPLNYVIFYFLSRFANYAELGAFEAGYTTMGLLTAILFVSGCAILLFECVRRAYGGEGALGFLLPMCIMCSSIVLFSLERANSILLSAVCMMFFVLCYRSESRILRECSLVALAIATALKGYPALMGMLLLRDKQFASAIRCAIYAVLLIFLPFAFLEGGFENVRVWVYNIRCNSAMYSKNAPAFGFGVMTAGIGKMLGMGTTWVPDAVPRLLGALCKVICVVGLIASTWQRSTWKCVLLLGCVIVCLQTNSAVYLGLYLLIGIALFFREANNRPLSWVYLVLVFLMLSPFQIDTGGGSTLTFVLMGLSCDVLLVMLTVSAVRECAVWVKSRRGLGNYEH